MARHSGRLASRAIHVDGVIPAFAQEFAPMVFQVPNQRAVLHALTLNGSRITSAPVEASSIN